MFKPGQKVVFIGYDTKEEGTLIPKIGEILTIKDYSISCKIAYGLNFYVLEEYLNQFFGENTLRPVQYNNVSAEIVAKMSIVEERSDVKIKEEELEYAN